MCECFRGYTGDACTECAADTAGVAVYAPQDGRCELHFVPANASSSPPPPASPSPPTPPSPPVSVNPESGSPEDTKATSANLTLVAVLVSLARAGGAFHGGAPAASPPLRASGRGQGACKADKAGA
ncbi:hypothetical protein CYMTET_27683 [Cymbomonas tetramitiformis]|uniref:EGF-like domain-containing protein n=1 Tax=Cymbomonas tetramitiformis TaxID=36881 RepID=A0AAE0FP98_9CHLO|nr:hypothetical protein CYMTET_27683 [Cymbomonas tetramitiformis]